MRWRFYGVLLFLGLSATPMAAADTVAGDLAARAAVSGDTLLLDDGSVLRLAGIRCCLPGDHAADDDRAARDMLMQIAGGQRLTVADVAVDRYGRRSGAVTVGDSSFSLQEALLDDGLAFVYSTGGDAPMGAYLAHERAARQAKIGIWGQPRYRDIDAAALAATGADGYGRFAFVTGRVVKAERIKNKVYLNFGEDWREDFTVTILAHDLRGFRDAGIDPLTLPGRVVRVRGWVKRDFGPMITVSAPWEVEVLEGGGP